MEPQQYYSILQDAVCLAIKRSRQPKDSLDVLKGLVSLSIASKGCKKYFNEELIIQLSYQYLRERTLFATNKLKYYIRNNDFINFEILADLIALHLRGNERLSTLYNLLPYVTQHASLPFLKEYIGYFDSRLYGHSLAHFFTNAPVNRKFIGFHPKTVTKAFKLANDNDWIDKTELLFEFSINYVADDMPEKEKQEIIVAKTKAAIAKKTKLNFEVLTHHLMNMYKRILFMPGPGMLYIYESLTHVLPSNAVKKTEELCALPIEQQPWFHGNLSRADIRNMFKDPSTVNCFVVTFYGSTLYSDQYRWKDERLYQDSIKSLLPNFGLKSQNGPIDLHLYHFYLSLVANDFEKIKNIAETHVLDWESTMRQPHPVTEYLNKVDDIREDIFDWLIERFGPVSNIKLQWERKYIPKSHQTFVRRLIPFKPRISGNFIAQLIRSDVPSSKSEMKLLAQCWDGSDSQLLWTGIFNEYPKLCKQLRRISEEKLMTLIAWKYADGESIGFRNLPKEIVKTIVSFADEPPLVYTFANILAGISLSRSIDYKFTKEWFENNEWSVKFYTQHADKLCYSVATRAKIAFSGLGMKFYRKHLNDIPKNMFLPKLQKVIFKYGSPNPESGTKVIIKPEILIMEAMKTQNRPALAYLIKLGLFLTPSREQFAASIKPKHKITYEEALDLVNQITAQVEAQKNRS